MLDNFFEIGGDSIRAIYVTSDLQNRGYTLSVSEIMMHDTLEDISKQLKPTDTLMLYKQNEISGALPFSPIQHAFLHAAATNPGSYMHSCILVVDCDETAVRKALDAVVLHHDLLRAVVCDDGLHIRTMLEAKAYSFAVEPRFQEDETIHRAAHELEKSDPVFDLKNGPLVAAVFCKTKRNYLLKLSIHHFLVDLISWEILLEDMQSALLQTKAGKTIVLPPKTASFPDWLCALSEYAASHISDEDRACWAHIEQELDEIKPLLVSDITANEAETFAFTLEKEETMLLLNEANRAFQTHPNELLLAALALAAKQVSGNSVGIYVESHGRAELHQHLSVNRTVGWFTCCYPVIARKEDNEMQTVVRIKETLRRTSKGGLDYLLLHKGLHRNADILFNYYKVENENDAIVAFQGEKALFPGTINVSCLAENGEMQVQIGVPVCPHKKGIAKVLGTAFQNQISEMTKRFVCSDSITKTRSDFSDRDLKESELDDMEALFNGMEDNE
jgi:aryl carrier-like protein